jgi:Stage II sporulation protein E (SpoIIE)
LRQAPTQSYLRPLPGFEVWQCRLPWGDGHGAVILCEPVMERGFAEGRSQIGWVFGVGDIAGVGEGSRHFRSSLAAEVGGTDSANPAALLGCLNGELCDRWEEVGFVCLILCFLDGERHELSLGNAGQPPPYIRRADGTVETVDETLTGMPLGVARDQSYVSIPVSLEPGDVMVLLSICYHQTYEPYAGDGWEEGRILSAIADAQADAASVGLGIVRAAESNGGSPSPYEISLICIGRIIDPPDR